MSGESRSPGGSEPGRRWEWRLSVCCLAVAVALLFVRPHLPVPPLPNPNEAALGGNPPVQGTPTALTIHYHERVPYYITRADGVHGLCADPVRAAVSRAGVTVTWQRTPPRRQLLIVRENRSPAAILGWFKTVERERFARFSRPIYRDRPAIALVRAEVPSVPSGEPLARLLTHPDLTLLRKDSYSYGPYVDRLIETLEPRRVTTAADNRSMLRMLQAGRADYLFIAAEEADALIALSGLPADAFVKVHFSDMPSGNTRHLMYSLKVDPGLVARIDAALPDPDFDPAKPTERMP